MDKKVVYIDMDDVLCNYSKAHKKTLEDNPEILFPQSQPGFFENLEPMSNAIESFHFFLKSDCFDPFILTAPSVLNPLCYTEKRLWVEKHLGLEIVDRLIISSHKGLLKGDYLIDDHKEGRGQEHFKGTLIQFGQSDFKDWEAVVVYFRTKYCKI
ncbi:hypothetical protein [uncultured Maribacter sp.]|uniref:5' nucleotidase, NT5C type n=1 Tax=uncultured Maribacter sp. TaxID=431308 RepID=UPI002626976B|nr:hypothetical protein [uncultured Maribacter sp.]